MGKMSDLLQKERSKRISELATKIEGEKMVISDDLKSVGALSRLVLAMKKEVVDQKKVLAEYYKVKKASLDEKQLGLALPPNNTKMIWQGNETAFVLDVNNTSIIGKETFLVEENNCYCKIRVKSIEPIDSTAFEALSSAHRLSLDDKERLFGKNKALFCYLFDVIERFDVPLPVASMEIGLVNEVRFLSDESQNERIEFEDETLVRDFMLAIASSDLVKTIPDSDIFMRTIFELVKQEPSLIKRVDSVCLFEETVMQKPNKVFYSKDELIDCLFGV